MMTTTLTQFKKKPSRAAGYTLIEIMIVVSLIGLLTAIGIPNFLRSRDCAQIDGIINNLRVIESAKDEWALQNHKGTGDTADWPDLSDFIKGGAIKPVAGETYTINAIGSPAFAVTVVKLGTYNGGSPINAQ